MVSNELVCNIIEYLNDNINKEITKYSRKKYYLFLIPFVFTLIRLILWKDLKGN